MEVGKTNKYLVKYINTLTSELVYGGYFVALSAPIYVFIASILLNININIPLLLIAYLTPLIAYSYNYYSEISEDTKSNPERSAFLASKKLNYILLIIAYITLLFILLILFGNVALTSFIALLAIIGILYTALFKDLTKKIPLLKNLCVSLVWAAGGSFFLLLYYSLDLSWFYILLFIFIFIQDIANVIFFDIKDYGADKERGLLTLPVILGKKKTIMFLYLLNIVGLIPILLGAYFNIFPIYSLFLLLIILYKIYYLEKAKSADDANLRFLSYTFVEAEFILLPILLVTGIVVTNMI